MAKNTGPKKDELLDEIDKLLRKEEAEKRASDKGAETEAGYGAAPGIKEGLQAVAYVGRFFKGIANAANAVWETALKPFWNIVAPTANWMGSKWKNWIWTPLAYNKDDDGERTIFSKKGATTAVALTMCFALAAGSLATAVPEGIDMAVTSRTKTVFLHTPRTTGVNNTYSVKGCDTYDQCDTNDVVYYNIEPSLAKHIYSLFNKGSLYVPKRLIGTISPDSNNKCEVTVFGTLGDTLEKVAQNIDQYPDLLDISCVRVDDSGNPIKDDATAAQSGVDVSSAQTVIQAPAPA